MTPDLALQLAVAIPALGAVVVALTGRWPNLREAVTLATGTALFGVVVTLLPRVLAGQTPRELGLIRTRGDGHGGAAYHMPRDARHEPTR